MKNTILPFLLILFFLDASFLTAQNVGINTTTPQTALHVADDDPVTGGVTIGTGAASDGGNLRLLSDSLNHDHWNLDNFQGSLRIFSETGFGTGAIERFRIWPSGNIGFNGSGLSTGFNVRNPSASSNVNIFNVQAMNLISRFIVRENGNAGFNGIIPGVGLSVINLSTSNPIIFNVRGADGTDRFQVLENGNVGIGATPKQQLHNSGDYYGKGHVWLHAFEGDGNSGTAYIQARDDSGYSKIGLQLRTQDAGNIVDALTILSTGRAGFHRTAAGVALNVYNRSAANNPIILNVQSENGTGRFQVWENGNAGFNSTFPNVALNVTNPSASNPFILNLRAASGADRFQVQEDGNIHAHNLPFGDHANMQYRPNDGRFFYDNSSRRYKENIQPLQDDFSLILQAQPKTYTRPANPDRWEVGYIAEEMDSLGLTKLVSYDKEGIPDGFNYEKMILYVTEILKMHQAKISELATAQQEIAELKQSKELIQAQLQSQQLAIEALQTAVFSPAANNSPTGPSRKK